MLSSPAGDLNKPGQVEPHVYCLFIPDGEHMSLQSLIRNSALGELSVRVEEITRLDSTFRASSVEAMHRACAAYHGLLASIAAAEGAGVSRTNIDEILVPVRAELQKAPFFQRTHTWPRGYAGDFETIEYLCQPRRFGTQKRLFADFAQEYLLSSPPVQQYRNQILKQAFLVLETVTEADVETRILSAACGGCPDLRMVLPMLRQFPGEFVLVDTDPDALAFSRRELGPIEDACEFVQEDALGYIEQAARRGETFDLVYAGGLFEYFTDAEVTLFVSIAHDKLLKPKGRLFFTNLAEGNLHRYSVEHYARWERILRSERSVFDLCRRLGIDFSLVKVERDSTGTALLVEINQG
jgi:extracellular factor (EF) 3-hydroxypalmitic acid methyl ester biosynthesis protein